MPSSIPSFRPLALSTLKPHTGYSRPYFHTPNPVKVTSSALEVMTDLRFVPAATASVDLDIELASQKMIARAVRLLLVVDQLEDVVGLITSRDLMGRRPLEVMDARGVSLDKVKVGDVMTGSDSIEIMPLDDVLHARVGDIIETLKNSGRQHALVVDNEPFSDKPIIRGIFSASQIGRQLGIACGNNELSQTFSQIDEAIAKQLAT